MTTTATNSSTLSFSLAGPLDSALANELAGVAQVTPFADAGAVGDALVVDGASAQVDAATIQQVLDRGSVVGVANPTAAYLSAIRKLAGAAPGGTPALVTLKKRATGKGYDFTCVQSPVNAVKQFMSTDGNSPVAVPPPAQSSVAAAGLQSALGATPAALLGDSALNFGIPAGAYGGMVSAYHTATCNFGTLSCDNITHGAIQAVTNTYSLDNYIYWVNGYANTPPYYIVIQRLHGSVSPGTVAVTNSTSQGFGNVFVNITPNLITDDNGNPIPGCTLLDSSPQTTTPGAATTTTSQTFEVEGDSGNGSGPVSATVSINNVVNYPGWGVQNLTSGVKTSWLVYQSDGVSFIDHANNDWQTTLPDSNGHLIAFPAMSFGSVPFDAVSVWQVTDPSFRTLQQGCEPALFSVGFYGEVDQYAVQNHVKDGCMQKRNDANIGVCGNYYWWNLDLNYVAALQNLPSTNS